MISSEGLDAPVQVLGESRGHHAIVVAVGDERGLGDPRQIVRRTNRSGTDLVEDYRDIMPG